MNVTPKLFIVNKEVLTRFSTLSGPGGVVAIIVPDVWMPTGEFGAAETKLYSISVPFNVNMNCIDEACGSVIVISDASQLIR
ncbi:hypothetical protein RE628_14480 [Paenibacillus sp. D2_2]|uniref:hypothetical protein n=1 Tax=Paenibacillus sp. D2_2 TaxID=3073092 RepID=UPI00281564F9|nr:hypothetical protein [Paenibacillus sp. D2_2]WMT43336.1 hypothetical protein RE628_14480 [Paenibacillus sp. D2_2]